MLFNSLHFLLFFPIVTLVYYLVPFKVRWAWLLAASYYFYMSWNPVYALLIAFSTLITYLSGLLIARANALKDENRRRRLRKCWVALSFVLNLGILFFFKYFDFTLTNLNRVLAVVGIQALQIPFDVLLPVGISFYTFQALGYTVDVYRGDIEAERHFGKYALFVSFFPQLVAGPIERSKNLLAQVHARHYFDYQQVRSGLTVMLWGFFEKMVVADRAAIFVNRVFGNIGDFAGLELVAAVVLFAVQIYCDFAGYSHIAIGAAQVMGFKLMTNFRQPYFAFSIRDFWQRWHISLSTWFRDYLYIPLGGNRKGTLRKYINLMVTFLASGFWHGASWNYVVWGGVHGAYQVLGDVLEPAKKKLFAAAHIRRDNPVVKYVRIVITFVLVDFAWIFFRAPGLRAALELIHRMFMPMAHTAGAFLQAGGLNPFESWVLLASIVLLFLVDALQYRTSALGLLQKSPALVRWVVYCVLLYIVLRFGVYGTGYTQPQFIYFQF